MKIDEEIQQLEEIIGNTHKHNNLVRQPQLAGVDSVLNLTEKTSSLYM